MVLGIEDCGLRTGAYEGYGLQTLRPQDQLQPMIDDSLRITDYSAGARWSAFIVRFTGTRQPATGNVVCRWPGAGNVVCVVATEMLQVEQSLP